MTLHKQSLYAVDVHTQGVGVTASAVACSSLRSQMTQSHNSLLGTPSGRYLVVDSSIGRDLGRWDSYGDAEAHVGEHCAMDPEADLDIVDLAVTPL